MVAGTSLSTEESVGLLVLLMGCSVVNASLIGSISVGASSGLIVGSCVGKIAGELVSEGTYDFEMSARRFSMAVSSSG